MLASDLMIGDWVKSRFGSLQVTNISFTELKYYVERESNTIDITFRLEDAEPIPLTPEILKENGFEETGMTFFKEIEKDVFLTYDTAENIAEIPSAFGDIKMRIDYVHHFQHALRLAGLDKHADKFKM